MLPPFNPLHLLGGGVFVREDSSPLITDDPGETQQVVFGGETRQHGDREAVNPLPHVVLSLDQADQHAWTAVAGEVGEVVHREEAFEYRCDGEGASLPCTTIGNVVDVDGDDIEGCLSEAERAPPGRELELRQRAAGDTEDEVRGEGEGQGGLRYRAWWRRILGR